MTSLTSVKSLSLIIFTSVFISACGGSGGGNSSNDSVVDSNEVTSFSSTAVFSSSFETSLLCPYGGIDIHTGIDTNQNGQLDEAEINNSQELCHADTSRLLTTVDTMEPESECFYGGNRLRLGYDENANGTLEISEVIQTNLFCAQQPALTLALLAYSNEFIDPGAECTAGGRKLSSGIDINGNRVLDVDEVSDVEYLCDYDSPIRPYYYEDDCEYLACDLKNVSGPIKIVPGQRETAGVTQIYGDMYGSINLTLADSAPDWLIVELSDYLGEYYYSSGRYEIYLATSAIPAEAYGQTFDTMVSVSDGQASFDVAFSVKVIEPINISLDKTNIEFTELGSNESQVQFIKVNFDKPLPETLYSTSSYHSGGLSNKMLDVYFVSEDEEIAVSRSNGDFDVEWIGDSLYRGQTEGTIMLTLSDDFLPEETENYKIIVGTDDYLNYREVAFMSDTLTLQINDDADAPINASLSLAVDSVVETSDPSDEAELEFTVSFDKPLPSDASIILSLEPTESEFDLHGKDVGFTSSCYSSYCTRSRTIPLYKGMAEYTSTIKIKPDVLKEGDENFKLLVKQNTSSFIIADLSATFTVVDDDEYPEINFVEDKIESYYQTSVINIPLELSNPSVEEVELNFSIEPGGTLLEGVHFDFAVSMPMVFSGRADELFLPIIIYDNEFEEDNLSATFTVEAVDGATNGTLNSMQLVLDKISPLYLSSSDFPLPITEGAYLYTDGLLIADDASIYKFGEIRDGNILGEEPIGERDLFLAKFNLDGSLQWARQFGTSSYDSISRSYVSRVGNGIFINQGQRYYFDENGNMSILPIIDYATSSSRSLEVDNDGNFYVLARKSHYSSAGDLDEDGSTTDFVLVKYDSEWNQIWATEDFSDIEPGHPDFEFNSPLLQLTESGVPYVFGYIREYRISSTFSTITGQGGDDLILASFDKTNGSTTALKLFGTDKDESSTYSLRLATFGDDKLLGFYSASGGSTVSGETLGSNATIKFEVDSAADIGQEIYKRGEELLRVNTIAASNNGHYFVREEPLYVSSPSYSSRFNKDFILEESVPDVGYSSALNSYFELGPVYLEEGSYLVTDGNHITKLTSTLKTRSP